jgi:predicted lysophospholipase L1 biosynthesis ABC-type transport system permease subunit
MGSHIRFGRGPSGNWSKIIGIVANTRDRGVTTTGESIYVNYLQTGIPVNYLVIRGNGTQKEMADLVRHEVARLDPGQAVASIATIAQLADRDTAGQRFIMVLLVIFGIGAILLAAAGVYSVVAGNVFVRRREIAIRTVLGADRFALIRQLMKTILSCVLAGELIGLAAVVAVGQPVSKLLYAVTPRDPAILSAALLFLFAVSVCAAFVPAWRAARKEPGIVLHAD